MKKIIIELLTKYFKVILENWVKNVNDDLKDKLTEPQIRTFVESSLKLLIEVTETKKSVQEINEELKELQSEEDKKLENIEEDMESIEKEENKDVYSKMP